MRFLKVEFRYFNKDKCQRCKATDKNIEKSLDDLKSILKKSNVKFMLSKKKLGEKRLKKSPTILINNKDIEEIVNRKRNPKTSKCSCCSNIAGKYVDCRSYLYKGKKYNSIPIRMIKEAIKIALKRS